MFLIKAPNMQSFNEAMVMLAAYHVVVRVRADMALHDFYNNVTLEVRADKKYFENSIGLVDEERLEAAGVHTIEELVEYETQSEYNHCELCFSMNFQQASGLMCDMCKEEVERTGNGEATCGHLTFTQHIDRG